MHSGAGLCVLWIKAWYILADKLLFKSLLEYHHEKLLEEYSSEFEVKNYFLTNGKALKFIVRKVATTLRGLLLKQMKIMVWETCICQQSQ